MEKQDHTDYTDYIIDGKTHRVSPKAQDKFLEKHAWEAYAPYFINDKKHYVALHAEKEWLAKNKNAIRSGKASSSTQNVELKDLKNSLLSSDALLDIFNNQKENSQKQTQDSTGQIDGISPNEEGYQEALDTKLQAATEGLDINPVDPKDISKDEGNTVRALETQYARYGFSFSSALNFRDGVKIQADPSWRATEENPNPEFDENLDQVVYRTDVGFMFGDGDGQDALTAEEMTKWMNEHKVDINRKFVQDEIQSSVPDKEETLLDANKDKTELYQTLFSQYLHNNRSKFSDEVLKSFTFSSNEKIKITSIEANKDVNKTYNNNIQEIAIKKYLEQKKKNDKDFSFSQLDYNKLVMLDDEGEFKYKNEEFQSVLLKTKKEANDILQKRFDLKEKLGLEKITQEEYDNALEKIDNTDEFNKSFIQKLVDQKTQSTLVENIDATLKGSRGEARNLKENIANNLLKDIRSDVEVKVEQLSVINDEFSKIDNQIKKLNNWFDGTERDEGKYILKRLKEISEGKYTSQASADAANAEINYLKSLYTNKVKVSEYLNSMITGYDELYSKTEQDLDKLDLNEGELQMYIGEATRNQNGWIEKGARLLNSISKMPVGVVEFIDMQYGAAQEVTKKIENPVTRTVVELGLASRGGLKGLIGYGLFGDIFTDTETGEKESLWDKVQPKVAEGQQYLLDSVKRPLTHEEVFESGEIDLNKVGDYVAGIAIDTAPTMAVIAAGSMGGPAGLAAAYAIIASNTAGNKYRQIQDSRDLYKQTGGMYGSNVSFQNMYANATLSGISEAAFEVSTQLIMGRTLKVLLGNTVAKKGFVNRVKSLVKPKNVINTAGEWTQEGLSEGLTTLSENISDRIFLGSDVDVFEGVKASAIDGALLGGLMTSPRLLKLVGAPFESENSEKNVKDILDRMNTVSGRINDLKNKGDNNKKVLDEISLLEAEFADLTDQAGQFIQQDIKRVDALHPSERAALIEIYRRKLKTLNQIKETRSDESLTPEERKNKLDQLKKQINTYDKRKQQIIGRYDVNVVDSKYEKQINHIKNIAKITAKAGGLILKPFMLSAKEFQNAYAAHKKTKGFQDDNLAYYESIEQSLIDEGLNPSKKENQVKEGDMYVSSSEQVSMGESIKDSKSAYGVMIPIYETASNGTKVLTGLKLLVNKDTAIKDGQIYTAAHEFVHAALFNTLKASPIARAKLGKHLDKIIAKAKFKGETITYRGQKMNKALAAKLAANDKDGTNGEEKLAVIIELMLSDQIELDTSLIEKLGDIFRRFTQEYFGVEMKLNTTSDVKNFLKDFHNVVKNDVKSKALATMINKGAKKFTVENFEEVQNDESHSKNISENLDWKDDFDQHTQETSQDEKGNVVLRRDENGKFIKKYPNDKDIDGNEIEGSGKEKFRNSEDISTAGEELMKSKGLANLIKQGIVGVTNMTPQELNTFVEDVKMNLYMRFVGGLSKQAQEEISNLEAKFKNKEIPFEEFIEKKEKLEKEGRRKGFDPAAANGSLFGWLTGGSGSRKNSTYWRARGDVMNKFKESGGYTNVSMEKSIGSDGGTIADVIPGETDQRIKDIDNMDMTPTRKRDVVKKIKELLKTKKVLGLTGNIINSITLAIKESKADLFEVTYKGVKKMLNSSVQFEKKDKKGNVIIDKKTGKPKMFTPTTEKLITPTGAYFQVLNAIAAEFGIDPLRIIAGQDLDATQRTNAQDKIFSTVINIKDGSYNSDLYKLLPKGQTRSGEATGVANTKLGQFYVKGKRLLSKDGADSKLGNKYEQNKRTNVSMKEFLGAFGINPDGTKIPGKQFDGILRELVLALSQSITVQEIKIDNIINGTNTQAIAAKLSDGSSDLSFSKKLDVNFENDLQDVLSDLIEINPDLISEQSMFDFLKSSLPYLSNADLKDMAKKFSAWNKEFINIEKANNTDIEFDRSLFLLDKINQDNIDKSLFKAISPNFTKDKDGNTAKDAKSLFTLDFVKKSRTAIADFTTYALAPQKIVNGKNVGGLGWSKQKLLRYMFAYAQGMYAGMGKIGDGRFIKDKNGNLIEDPKWENELNNDGSIKTYGNKYKRYKKNHPLVKEGKKKVGDVIFNDNNKPILQDFRGQITLGVDDLISILDRSSNINLRDNNGRVLSKKEIINKYKVNTSVYAETSDAAIKDKDYKGRKAQAKEVRGMLQDQVKFITDMAKSNNSLLGYEELVIFARGLSSGMRTPMRQAANVRYFGVGIESVSSNKRSKELEYEHMIPASFMTMELIQSYLNDGKIKDNFWEGFHVAIIPKTMDTALTKSGLRDSMNIGWRKGMPTWMRYFNDQTFGKEGLVALKDLSNNKIIANKFVKQSNKFIKEKINNQKIVAEVQSQKESFSKKIPEIKGASVFDFDETVGVSKNVVIATKDGEVKKIASDQWPFVGDKLIEEGWQMDFTDFNKVTDGKPGPLFNKMKRQIEKFGPKNVFILTARGPGSQPAIHAWLASNGINIPIENITGLGQSSGDAKAQWMLDLFKQGYNDMYFADDALPNVEAVKFVLNQLDVKSKVVQAGLVKVGKWIVDTNTKEGKDFIKDLENIPTVSSSEFKNDNSSFSKKIETNPSETAIDLEFNTILERKSGIKAERKISKADAQSVGKLKNAFRFFVPPSAEDFKGLIYRFLGKGKQGEADIKWFKKFLFDPYARAYNNWNTYKQNMANEYYDLKKSMPDVVKSLRKKVYGDGIFARYTNDTAIRVYLWSKAGFEIPGISKEVQKKLVEHVMSDPDLLAFAESLSKITRTKEGYIKPSKSWVVETVASDLARTVNEVGRKGFMQEWIENKNIIFSKANLNKIEAIYGSDFRYELEQMLYRMETGQNRSQGKDKNVNAMLDWINGSVGAVMFFNMRSAVLQTISFVNFVNFEDNNVFAAAAAFANQPQFWKDFAFLINSPMLKQRRAGLAIDVSASELTKAFAEGGGKTQAVIAYMLEKGFIPTKMADSFAIALGGASFYRNRTNRYIKEGMSKAEAEKQAMLDFQEVAEETQQSSRPDFISNQQAGPLGRLILAWQNTPMQMTRLTKKALSDLVNGRGSAKANISKIIYYGIVQNLIFGALQTGLAFLMFGDTDDEEKRNKELMVLNGAFDTLLRGTGIYGAMLSTLKNTYLEVQKQNKKGFGKSQDAKIIQQMIGLSPPIGTKTRKLMNAYYTYKYNKGVGKQVGFRIENPTFDIATNIIEGLTNAPLNRILHKANNLEEAITGNHKLWQRIAIASGWSMWSVGVRDEELEEAKLKARELRKIEQKKISDIKKDIKKKENAIEKEKEKKEKEEENKKKGIKTIRCSGKNSSGKRCGLTTETSAKTWKCSHHMKFTDGMDRDGDGVKEYQCIGKTSSGKRCRNKGEYGKARKCYAHK